MTSHPGVMVMLKSLFGDRKESAQALIDAQGKTIQDIALVPVEHDIWRSEHTLRFCFTDDSKLELFDDGQSCCEHRYMHTDDELADFHGAEFLSADLRDGPTEKDKYGEPKESQFLIIRTSIGEFTVVNYNEHNGYYGGFWLVAKYIPS